jgi:hypothetical protein
VKAVYYGGVHCPKQDGAILFYSTDVYIPNQQIKQCGHMQCGHMGKAMMKYKPDLDSENDYAPISGKPCTPIPGV